MASLNLTVEKQMDPIQVGQTVVARIAPTAADGGAAPVTGVKFDVQPAGAYTIAPAADGLSAVYTAAVPGGGCVATVTALSAAGATLTDNAALPDVAAPPVAEAVKLNLTISAS